MDLAIENPGIVAATPSTPAVEVAASRWALALAVVHAVLAGSTFALLGAVFGFSGILREPAGVALAAVRANEGTIRFGYDLFTLSAFLFVPIAMLARAAFGGRKRVLLTVARYRELGMRG